MFPSHTTRDTYDQLMCVMLFLRSAMGRGWGLECRWRSLCYVMKGFSDFRIPAFRPDCQERLQQFFSWNSDGNIWLKHNLRGSQGSFIPTLRSQLFPSLHGPISPHLTLFTLSSPQSSSPRASIEPSAFSLSAHSNEKRISECPSDVKCWPQMQPKWRKWCLLTTNYTIEPD